MFVFIALRGSWLISLGPVQFNAIEAVWVGAWRQIRPGLTSLKCMALRLTRPTIFLQALKHACANRGSQCTSAAWQDRVIADDF